MDRQSQQQPWKARIFWHFNPTLKIRPGRFPGGGDSEFPGGMPRINSGWKSYRVRRSRPYLYFVGYSFATTKILDLVLTIECSLCLESFVLVLALSPWSCPWPLGWPSRFCSQRTSAISTLDVLRRCALQIYILTNLLEPWVIMLTSMKFRRWATLALLLRPLRIAVQ